MSYKYSKYRTSSDQPKCVKYWDKVYKNEEFWFDWMVLKTSVEAYVKEIMEENDYKIKEARDIAWHAYIAATMGDEDSRMDDAYSEFCICLNDRTIAIYTPHLTIGSEIHFGNTKKEAMSLYVEWLKTDDGLYGDYYVNEDLSLTHKSKIESKRK